MTTTKLDQERPELDTHVHVRDARRWWAAALGGFLAGVLAVVAVIYSRPEPAAPAPPAPLSANLRFAVWGDGQVDFTGVWTKLAGPGEVEPDQVVPVTEPWTAVMTVRADPGKSITCLIYVGDTLVAQVPASDGATATCVDVRRVYGPTS